MSSPETPKGTELTATTEKPSSLIILEAAGGKNILLPEDVAIDALKRVSLKKGDEVFVTLTRGVTEQYVMDDEQSFALHPYCNLKRNKISDLDFTDKCIRLSPHVAWGLNENDAQHRLDRAKKMEQEKGLWTIANQVRMDLAQFPGFSLGFDDQAMEIYSRELCAMFAFYSVINPKNRALDLYDLTHTEGVVPKAMQTCFSDELQNLLTQAHTLTQPMSLVATQRGIPDEIKRMTINTLMITLQESTLAFVRENREKISALHHMVWNNSTWKMAEKLHKEMYRKF